MIKFNEYKLWFKQFVKEYTTTKETAYLVKVAHTGDVVRIAQDIANKMNLSATDTTIAGLSALFHDLGRFYQYQKYKTFNDSVSCDHAQISIEIIQKTNVLGKLPVITQEIICAAITEHNKIAIQGTYNEHTLLHVQLLRDADKISNFPFFIANYEKFTATKTDKLNIAIVDNILHNEPVSNKNLVTLEDFKLYHLSWMNDIYLKASKEHVLGHKFIDQIVASLPPSECIFKIKEHLINRLET